MAIKVVVFDVLETLFSLENLRPRLQQAGLPPAALELWFSRTLRDGFALTVTETFAPFVQVAFGALTTLMAEHGRHARPQDVEQIMAGLSQLDPERDVEAVCTLLHRHRVKVACLTNGSAVNTEALLERARLGRFIDAVVSIDEVQKWKPHRQVYRHALERIGCPAQQAALVAVHDWDTHGAKSAGLRTGWLQRQHPRYASYLQEPDVIGRSLSEVCEKLLSL
jgi:2-haloacid dehalogenase